MTNLKKLYTQAKVVRKESGIRSLLRSAWQYALRPIYAHDRFDLYAFEINNSRSPGGRMPDPPVEHISHKTVSSIEDVEKLEAEGFIIRSDTVYWKRRRELYNRRITHGTIAWCTFIGKDLAAVVWIIPSKDVQEKIRTSRIKVDFASGEALAGGAWTHPQHRKLAFFNYNLRHLQIFLADNEIKTLLIPVNQLFRSSHTLMKALGSRQYGRGDHYRIIRYEFWKESYNCSKSPGAKLIG